MPNGQQDNNGIDMDAFNESVGKGSNNPAPKLKPAPAAKQHTNNNQPLTGVKNGIDLDAFNESLKKKAGSDNSTNGSQPIQSSLKDADDKVNAQAPPPTQEEQAKIDLEKSKQQIQEKNNGLLNSIQVFNHDFNTEYNPMEVFASADKTADFLQQYKAKNTQTKAEIQQARQSSLQGSESFGQPIPTNINPVIQTGNFVTDADKNIQYLTSHVVNKTIEEDKSSGITKAQTINKIYKRIDPKNYKILSEISNQNPFGQAYRLAVDPILGDDLSLENELLLSSKGQSELMYNNGLRDLANNSITTGIANKDERLIKEGQNYLSESKSDDEILKNYPALQKQRIAFSVSQAIAKDAGQLEGTETKAGETGTKYFGASEDKIQAKMQELGYLDNPNTKDIALSMLNQKYLFSDASYLGGIGNALLRPFKELGLSFLDITHLRSEAGMESTKKQEQMFPEETEGLKTSTKAVRTIANTTANLAGMTAIAALTEGAGEGVGLSAATAKQLAAYTSFGLPAYDAAYKESSNFLNSEPARMAYATLSAVANAEGGRLLDLGKVVKIPGVSEDISKLAEGITTDKISDNVKYELINSIKDKYTDFAMKYAKNVTKGAATMAGFNVANNIQRVLFGDPTEKVEDILPQAGKAFVDGVLGMSILGGFGAASDMKEEKNTSYKGFIYNMAINHDATADVFKLSLDKGDYTQQEYNEKMKILNTSRSAKASLDAEQNERNIDLDERQKSVYVANKTAIALLENKADESSNEQEKKKYESQVNKLNEQNNKIFDGLQFNSALTPLHDLHDAEKEYDSVVEQMNETGKEPKEFDAKKKKFEDLQKKYSIINKTSEDENNESKNAKNKETEGEKGEGENSESEKPKTVEDKDIVPTFEQVKLKIPEKELADTQDVITKVNNAEEINEKDLEKGQNGLYSALEAHPEAAHLIEPLITKLQDYEFTTKTETSTTTEREPIEGSFAAKTKQEIKPALEHSIGGEAEVTQPDGSVKNGTLKLVDGNYVLDVDGEDPLHIGEKAITDRDLKLPSEEQVEDPIKFDKDGNVASVTFETKEGNLVSIKDPEKALDLAIQLQANAIGEIPDESFEKAYNEVQTETQKEVPIRNNSQLKTTQDGNEKNSQENGKESSRKKSNEESGSKKNDETNVVPKVEANEPVSSEASTTTKETQKAEGLPIISEKKLETIGMANTIINEKRVEQGMHELVSEGSRSFKQAWSDLMNRITGSEKFKPRDFIQDKYDQFKNKNKKIAFTDDDEVAWYFDAVNLANDQKRLENEYKEGVKNKIDNADLIGISDNLSDINTKIQQSQELARHVGTIGARTLAFRNNLVNLNKEVVAWNNSFRTQYGNLMPERLYKQIEGMEKQYKDVNEELSKHYDSIYNKAFDDAYKKAKSELSKTKPTKDEVIKEKTLKQKGASAADKILKLQIKQDKNTLQSNPFQLGVEAYNLLIKGIAESVRLGATVADAIDTMLKKEEYKSLKRDDVINHLTGGFSYAEKIDKSLSDIKEAKKIDGATQITSDMVKPIKSLIDAHIQNNPDAKESDIIKMATDDLKELFPDISEKEIRNTYSGLGVKEETKEKIQSNISKFKGMMKDVSDFFEMSTPKHDESPKEEFNRKSKLRKQFDKIKPYLEEMGIQVETPTGYSTEQKERAYQSGSAIAKSLIEDTSKERARLEEIKKKSGSDDNNQRIEILTKEHNKLSSAIDEINKSGGSNEEKVKKTRDLLKNQIDNYKAQKERYKRDNILKSKDSEDYNKNKSTVTALNERISDLGNRLKYFDEQADPYVSPEEKAISKLNNSLHNQAEKWQSKLERRDFDQPKEEKVEKSLQRGNTPSELLYGRDKKTVELELKAKRLENDYYAIRHAAEISKNGTFKKVVSMIAAIKRSFVLSRGSTFIKLAGAATENIVTAPFETTAGVINYGLSGFGKTEHGLISPKLINKAMRYGVPIINGEIDALKLFGDKKTWEAFKKNIKGQPDDLSLLYSGGSDYDYIGNIPPEYRNAWMQIEHGLELPSRGHGATKGLAKTSEYARSFVTRMEAVKRIYGEEKSLDPLMQQLVGSLAYADAKRSILMEDNLMTDAYHRLTKSLQKGGVGANILGLTLNELMPVVKVPTNMALMTGRAVTGLPLAGGEIAFRSIVEMINGNSKYGISQLSPERADALLRNLRKGQVGMALMMAGYFNPNMFGASPLKTKGTTNPNGLEDDEVKLFGLEIPKLFVDNPYLMTMRIGATLGQLYKNNREDDYGVVASAMCAAAKTGAVYVTNELPLLSTPIDASSSISSLVQGKTNMNWWMYSQLKATIEPGALQNIAEIQDSDNWWQGVIGKGNKRKAHGLEETLESGIPNLGFNSGFNRQQVDLK